MRRPLKQYAVALYNAVKTQRQSLRVGTGQAPGANLRDIETNFIKLLQNDGVLSKAEKIFALFRTHWNSVEKEVDITLTSTHPISSPQQKHIGDAVEKTLGMEKHTVHTAIDPTLLGGVVIRYNDTVLDGSVRRQLSQIKTALQE